MSQIESKVQRRALLVSTGDKTVTSYLDSVGHVSDIYELNGTAYSYAGSVLRSRDFTDYTKVTKIGDEQRLLFNLSATGLSDVFYSPGPDLDSAFLSPTVYELSAMVSALSTGSVPELPFSVSLARDRFHQYICKSIVIFS